MKGVIEIRPLSNNAMWQGRRFKTPNYKAYENEVLWALKSVKRRVSGNYRMWVDFHLTHASTTDISNLIKPLEDIFVKAGLVDDDRFCTEMFISKTKSDVNKIMWKIENVDVGEVKTKI